MLAFLAFLIGAILSAVNGPDLGHNPWFWLLVGLAALCLEAAIAVPWPTRRRG
jgi:hypothetical protein